MLLRGWSVSDKGVFVINKLDITTHILAAFITKKICFKFMVL